MSVISGIHHVTAIAGDPQRNVDFYTGVLGLRLVKKTVNFDDPYSYHFYYGNGLGDPGSIITFFAWPGAQGGQIGVGQVTTTGFSVAVDALEFWETRLAAAGVAFRKSENRFGDATLAFNDPDGVQLELVGVAGPIPLRPWEEGHIPLEAAIRGFYSVSLSVSEYEKTDQLLRQLGFRPAGAVGSRYRYMVGEGGPGTIVDLFCQPDQKRGQVAAGTVHHVAWRTPDDEQHLMLRKEIAAVGLNVSPVMDRQYFHSIYFREPGGVLFEIATDPPGFLTDETAEQLGSSLKLPPWLEPQRAEIERILPPVTVRRS